MGPYRVFYMNQFLTAFPERDDALEFILSDSNRNRRAWGDYEIRDSSDYL